MADQHGIPAGRLPPFAPGNAISCFVGPPGGFSDAELGMFDERSSTRIRIARARLRTELAATVLCALVTEKNL